MLCNALVSHHIFCVGYRVQRGEAVWVCLKQNYSAVNAQLRTVRQKLVNVHVQLGLQGRQPMFLCPERGSCSYVLLNQSTLSCSLVQVWGDSNAASVREKQIALSLSVTSAWCLGLDTPPTKFHHQFISHLSEINGRQYFEWGTSTLVQK